MIVHLVGVKMIDIILYNVIYLGFNGIGDSWSCGSSRIQVRKQNIEVSAKSEDGYEVINIEDVETAQGHKGLFGLTDATKGAFGYGFNTIR
ncbi:hypothetical protein Tco_0897014, partial [Tanacetum coccineum]